jgi:hypothetical protein
MSAHIRDPHRQVIHLTQRHRANYEAWVRTNPEYKSWRDLLVQYAKDQGPRTFEILRLSEGLDFGGDVMMTEEAIARRLKMPVSEVSTTVTHAIKHADSAWEGTPDQKRFAAREARGETSSC